MALARELGVTRSQVQYDLEEEILTPSKRLGRPPVLNSDQVNELELFDTSSSTDLHRSFFGFALVQFRYWIFSGNAIIGILKDRGNEQLIA